VRRDDQPASSANSHSHDTLIPPFDDVTGTERELERLAAVPRGVELLTAGDADTDVVNDGATTGRGLVAGPDDEILDEEVIGSRTEVWIY
jgi:hypothetical protein